MLWFVGLGIDGYQGLAARAINILKSCKKICIERFTSETRIVILKNIRALIDAMAMR